MRFLVLLLLFASCWCANAPADVVYDFTQGDKCGFTALKAKWLGKEWGSTLIGDTYFCTIEGPAAGKVATLDVYYLAGILDTRSVTADTGALTAFSLSPSDDSTLVQYRGKDGGIVGDISSLTVTLSVGKGAMAPSIRKIVLHLSP